MRHCVSWIYQYLSTFLVNSIARNAVWSDIVTDKRTGRAYVAKGLPQHCSAVVCQSEGLARTSEMNCFRGLVQCRVQFEHAHML